MQQDKVMVRLGGVSETLMFPLWGRAQLSKEYSSLFYDAKAVELVEKIDYDFSASDLPFGGSMFNTPLKDNLLPMFSLVALMGKQFDDKIKAYITEHPHASVVNIGAGLDATFYRVDNGLIHWYDLDLPAVIDIRKQLLPEPDRVTCIAKSLFDPSWCKDVKYTEDGVFMFAGEVLQFFEETQVRQFFSMLADNFPDGEIVFTAMSRSDGFREWMDVFPPEQRDAMRAAWMGAMKEWWEKVPQDEKDKAITALKTPTKPKGTEWSDLEAWWETLSDEENAEALRDLTTTFSHMPSGRSGWTLEDTNKIPKWDNRITVIDQLSLFKNIPRDSLSGNMRKVMDHFDESEGLKIFHLRV